MGSVSSKTRCPICGMMASWDSWTHSGRESIRCPICSYSARKIIYLENKMPLPLREV